MVAADVLIARILGMQSENSHGVQSGARCGGDLMCVCESRRVSTFNLVTLSNWWYQFDPQRHLYAHGCMCVSISSARPELSFPLTP